MTQKNTVSSGALQDGYTAAIISGAKITGSI
jgi:hypothetical protein